MERKMFLGAIVVLSAMAAAFFGARQVKQSRPDSVASRIAVVQREIAVLQRGIQQAEAERNAAGVAAFFSEDARFFPLAEEPQLGRQQIEEFYQRTPYLAERSLRRIELQGDLAIAIGDFSKLRDTANENSRTEEFSGEESPPRESSSSGFLSIWRRNGEKWELMLDLHEPTQFDSPPG